MFLQQSGRGCHLHCHWHTSIPEEAVYDEEMAPELGDGDLPEVERGDGRDEADTQTRHRPAAWTL